MLVSPEFSFAIRANDLTKKGMFKSAPSAFMVIQRDNGNGSFSPVYKSNVVSSNDDPVWKPFAVKDPQPEVHIRGDANVRYQFVGQVLVATQQIGIRKVAFITTPDHFGPGT